MPMLMPIRLVSLLVLLGCGASNPAAQETQREEPGGGETAEPARTARIEESVAESTAIEAPAAELRADETTVDPAMDEPSPLVVFLAVRAPSATNQSALIEALRAENFEAEAEGRDEVVLIVPEERFVEYFRAGLGETTTGASSSDRTITIQTLDRYHIPRRLRRLVESVYFDHQR